LHRGRKEGRKEERKERRREGGREGERDKKVLLMDYSSNNIVGKNTPCVTNQCRIWGNEF
jgi:hypothetical protein